MKASDFGSLPPSTVGLWSYNLPGVELWSNDGFETKSEAIEEGRAVYGSGTAFEVGRFSEAEVDAPDANDAINQICNRMCDEVPSDLVDDFLDRVPEADKDRLTAALEKAVGEWLTETSNWPTFSRVADIESVPALEG